MPRPRRMEFAGAFYHVYSRGNRREIIFQTPEDYSSFEISLFEKAKSCGIRLYAWCLMPNHFHLLLETPLANLSRFMQRLLTRYARLFNKRHRLVGHVFQSRYKARVCEHDAYFLELIRYLHLNPVNVKGKALTKTLEDWRWSSHRYYLQGQGPESLQQTIDKVLGRFHRNKSLAIDGYRQFMQEGLTVGHLGNFENFKGAAILGSAKFKEKPNGATPLENSVGKTKTSAEELALQTARAFGISLETLCRPDRDHKTSRIRQAFIYVGRRLYRLPAVRLAEILKRDVSAVSQSIRRLEEREKIPEEVQMLMSKLRLEAPVRSM